MIKQVLDTDVAGITMPHIETAEEAMNVVAAARYPQKPGSADFLPEGHRRFNPAIPQRYRGFGATEINEYLEEVDIWGPADPVILDREDAVTPIPLPSTPVPLSLATFAVLLIGNRSRTGAQPAQSPSACSAHSPSTRAACLG